MVFQGPNPAGRQKKGIGRRYKNGNSYRAYQFASAAAGPDADVPNPDEAEPNPAQPAYPVEPPPFKKPQIDGS